MNNILVKLDRSFIIFTYLLSTLRSLVGLMDDGGETTISMRYIVWPSGCVARNLPVNGPF